MRLRAALANSAWLTLALGDWRRFRGALIRPDLAQQQVRNEIEAACLGTPGFATRLDDIEPRSWEAFDPLVQRLAAGERGVLSREAVTHFEPTSGSAAARKLVPSTKLLRRQFNRAIHAWVADMLLNNRRILGGPSYWSISPAIKHEPTPAGIPVGYEDDSEYLGKLGQWVVRHSLAVPSAVRPLGHTGVQASNFVVSPRSAGTAFHLCLESDVPDSADELLR